ncbi:competence type IV pilus minor pilin ComGE [Streptococcus sp. zg-JUN1979]
MICSLVLAECNKQQKRLRASQARQEALVLATMAFQTKEDSLSMNGETIQIKRSNKGIWVYHNGEELLHAQKK